MRLPEQLRDAKLVKRTKLHQHNHSRSSERIAWAFFLNLGFTILEFIGGWLSNSTAIMADAVHDLGDSLSIGSAWLLNKLGARKGNGQFTYGYRRLSLFGALINGLVLVAGSTWIFLEAIPRLADPVMPKTGGMLILAVLGVSVNGYAAFRLSKGKSLNEKVLNWHLLEDVLGWVVVLIGALIMHFVDWPIIDPLLSIAFTVFILVNVIRNLWETGRLFIQASPDPELVSKIQKALTDIDGVDEVHHLHLWSLDGEHHVLTTHVIACIDMGHYRALKERLRVAIAEFDLAHTTIEIELAEEPCRDQFGPNSNEKR